MGKNRAYRATAVKSVHLEEVMRCREGQAATVGADIGKEEAQVMVRWQDGTFERPWRVKNPGEVRDVTELLTKLSEGRCLKVGMEPTGTYGEAFRQAWTDAKLEVHRVGGKAVHDYAEIFDGVPSQHDGKDAAIVAELVALGKSSPWPYRASTAVEAEMGYWVDWLDAQQTMESMWIGRLEGLMARHWPEATRLLKLGSVTLLQAMARYGGPGKLAEDKDASGVLAGWGGPGLTAEKIEAVLRSAAGTVGVRPCGYDLKQVQRCATMALSAYREVRKARKELVRLGEGNAVLQRQSEAVGMATACVLWVALGDPRDYRCGEAYRKAMGLNLKERSSGKYEGKLKITKRGPSAPRRWLYFAAMRLCQEGSVRRWYERKKTKDKGRGEGALIAIVRKLALALYRVAVDGKPFDPSRLFPGCDKCMKKARDENPSTQETGDGGSAKKKPKGTKGGV
jgi:transposase